MSGKDTYEEAVKEILHQNENFLVDNFEKSEIEDWEGFIQENYGEKNCQNQPHSKEVSAIEPAKKRMKINHDSNLDFDVIKNLQQIVIKNLQQIDKEKNSKAKKPKKSDTTDAKYVCEECQKEG